MFSALVGYICVMSRVTQSLKMWQERHSWNSLQARRPDKPIFRRQTESAQSIGCGSPAASTMPSISICAGYSKACSKGMLCICNLAADPALGRSPLEEKRKTNKKDSSYSQSPESDAGPTSLMAKALSWTGSCQAGILIRSTTIDACQRCRRINQNSLTSAIFCLKMPLTSSDG